MGAHQQRNAFPDLPGLPAMSGVKILVSALEAAAGTPDGATVLVGAIELELAQRRPS